MLKAPASKEVIQALIRANRIGPPVVGDNRIVRLVATKDCLNLAFDRDRDTLCMRLPAVGA